MATVNVLADLGTASWSAQQALVYEDAREAVRQAVGYYAQLIGIEEAAAEPDRAAIAGWRAEQEAWVRRGFELTPRATEAIEQLRAEGNELLTVDNDEEDEEAGDVADDQA